MKVSKAADNAVIGNMNFRANKLENLIFNLTDTPLDNTKLERATKNYTSQIAQTRGVNGSVGGDGHYIPVDTREENYILSRKSATNLTDILQWTKENKNLA